MPRRLTLATAWLSGCAGCHVTLVDAQEGLLSALEPFEIVLSPLVDFKDVPDKVDVAVIEGAVASEHDVELAKALRDAAGIVVSLGTCATHGGITGMRNFLPADEVRAACYEAAADGTLPGDSEDVTSLAPVVHALPQVIEVDHEIPGCPPLPATVVGALAALAKGQVPEYPRHNLCHECSRKKEQMLLPKREFITDNVYAPFELEEIDATMCFLEQGVICMGPMTREGCGTPCVKANMPCRGCWGPAVTEMAQGAKVIDALAPLLPAGAIMYLDDLVGIAYRYSLPVSIFGASTRVTERASGPATETEGSAAKAAGCSPRKKSAGRRKGGGSDG